MHIRSTKKLHRFWIIAGIFFLIQNTTSTNTLNLCCDFTDQNSNAVCGRESSLSSKTSWDAPSAIITTNQSVKFELKKKAFDCSLDQSIITTINEEDEVYRLMPIGYLHFKHPTRTYSEFIHPDDYCINNIEKNRVEVKICENDCSKSNSKRPCIRKCCPFGQVYRYHSNRTIKGCFDQKKEESGASDWAPHFYHDFQKKLTDEEVAKLRPRFIESKPMTENFNCTGTSRPILFIFSQEVSNILKSKLKTNDSLPANKFRLLHDGNVLLRDTNGGCNKPEVMKYCIDAIFDYGHKNPYSNLEDEQLFISCSITYKNQEYNDEIVSLYGIVMLCSSPFLLITVIVYFILFEKQNVHGWVTMSHAGTMFFFYVFLGISHIIKSAEVLHSPFCVTLGVFAHFFYLSTFLWLSIICFDIWWTFRSIKPTTRSKGVKKYIYYALVGWVLPLCFTIICLVLDRVMRNVSENECKYDKEVKFTGYGRINCNVDPKAMGLYLFYPLGILLVFNLIFVLFTMFKLYTYQKGTSFAKENVVGKNKQMLKVFIKLFFVMGISWIFEIVSWIHSENEKPWYWVIFDLINLFQSVAIFIIYVCKKDVLNSLEESHPILQGCINPIRNLFSKCNRESMQKSESAKTEMEEISNSLSSNSNKSRKEKVTRQKS